MLCDKGKSSHVKLLTVTAELWLSNCRNGKKAQETAKHT